jgi:hypothetical protein
MDALVYTIDGHPTYVLTSEEWSLAYDVASGEWHERRSENYPYWRAIALSRDMESFFGDAVQEGVWLVGDRQSGRIGELDPDVRTEFGETIRVVTLSQNINDYPRPVQADSIHIDFQAGVGVDSGQGITPKVMIRFTDDLGTTWTPEIQVPLGATGATHTRVTLDRQGTIPPTGRIYEVSYSDPTEFVLLSADLQAERGEVDG